MSLEYRTNVDADELIDFLLDEHEAGTGIPVHPFSVINADMSAYNRTPGITNGDGTLFVSDEKLMAYGCHNNNHNAMLVALRRCGVTTQFVW